MIANMNGGFNPSGTINITSNGSYDVKDFAEANVSVVSAPELLWTNPDPTSPFPAQTVNVNGADYDAYLIKCNRGTNDTSSFGVALIQKNVSFTQMIAMGPKTLSNGCWARQVSSATNTSVVFDSSLGYNPNARDCIPTHIWGVKYTL